MRKARALTLILALTVTPVGAKPLITSSEDTVARVCLAQTEPPARIVEACDAALTDAALTQSQRVDLMVARG